MTDISQLIENNRRWAAELVAEDPEYFTRHAESQAPKYLWIGCSDSRLAAERITGLQPGELFVHRNVANLVREDDLNLMSVVHYAVDVLKVEHIIVCGHDRCGGVTAALDEVDQGAIESWLKPIRRIAREHAEELRQLTGTEKINRMCDWNAIAQADALARTPTVQEAWSRGQPLQVHSWTYEIASGHLKELGEPRHR